jgi:SulP family sulfate permease
LSFAILAGFPPLVGLYAAFIMGLVTAILEVDLEWYLAEQGNSDCFNCFDEVKRLRICICSCSFSRVIQILIGLFKLVNS